MADLGDRPKFIHYVRYQFWRQKGNRDKPPPEVAVVSLGSPYLSYKDREMRKAVEYLMLKLVRETETRLVYAPYNRKRPQKRDEIAFMRITGQRVGARTYLEVAPDKDAYDIDADLEARREWNETAEKQKKQQQQEEAMARMVAVSEAWEDGLEERWCDAPEVETHIGPAKVLRLSNERRGDSTAFITVRAVPDPYHNGKGKAPLKWFANLVAFSSESKTRLRTGKTEERIGTWYADYEASCLEELIFDIVKHSR